MEEIKFTLVNFISAEILVSTLLNFNIDKTLQEEIQATVFLYQIVEMRCSA